MRKKPALIHWYVIALLAATIGAATSRPAHAQFGPEWSALALASSLEDGGRDAIIWGGLWGGVQGMSLAVAMDFGGGEWLNERGEVEQAPESGWGVFASTLAGGVVGVASGMLAARRGISKATARTAQMVSVWGLWVGLATSRVIDLDENPGMATMMAAGNGGLLAGALAGSRWAPSEARIRRMGGSAMTAALVGAGMVWIADGDDRTKYGVGLAGGVLGLALGAIIPIGDDTDESRNAGASETRVPRLGGSLLNRARGGWSLSAPLPSPALDSAPGAKVPERADRGGLVWRVPLLNVRFR